MRLPAGSGDSYRALAWRRWKRSTKVQRVAFAQLAVQARRVAWACFCVLQWHLFSICIAGGAKVCSAAGFAGRYAHGYARPLAGSRLGYVVCSALFQFSFYFLSTSIRLYQLRTQLLRLQFERMRALYLRQRSGRNV